MEKSEALKIINEFYEILSPTEKQRYKYIEALKCLSEKKYLFAMLEYGNAMAYYGNYELAKKYYSMVIELDHNARNPFSESSFANVALGDLYKNNYICSNHYELAYQHYLAASTYGNDLAKERIADMYRMGIYVKKDYKKYVEIITELYNKNADKGYCDLSLCQKMAEIKYEKKDYEGCKKIVKIFEIGSGFSAINMFSIRSDIKSIIGIHKLKYKLGMIDETEFDIFSISALVEKYNQFSFKYHNKRHILKYNKFDRINSYEFMGTKYKTLTDFVLKAKIQDKTILEVMECFTNYRVCA